jgi:hypothetical protein
MNDSNRSAAGGVVAAVAGAAGPINSLLAGRREYPFVAPDRRARELVPAGTRPINFSIGDPRERTPAFIREAIQRLASWKEAA